jgi:hypothetical protein
MLMSARAMATRGRSPPDWCGTAARAQARCRRRSAPGAARSAGTRTRLCAGSGQPPRRHLPLSRALLVVPVAAVLATASGLAPSWVAARMPRAEALGRVGDLVVVVRFGAWLSCRDLRRDGFRERAWMPRGPGQADVGSACVPYTACAAGGMCGSFTSPPGQVTRKFLATRYLALRFRGAKYRVVPEFRAVPGWRDAAGSPPASQARVAARIRRPV